MNPDVTAAPRNSSGDTDVFYYTFADSDEKELNRRAKRLLVAFLFIIGVPGIAGMYFGFFNPLQIAGGGVGRGGVIGLICIAPALLSLPLLRRKIIGSYSQEISSHIIRSMGSGKASSAH